MEAKASVTNIRITPQKAKLVVDLVRGKNVQDALDLLSFTNKSTSATANATNNFKMDETKLYIKEIWVGPGRTLKRFRPANKGSAHKILKRTCHINIVVSDER